ncbi:MAG: PAS domain S-box protein [Candidatus Eisenbacteria bacterium]|nr:PAS domain S-box protein [Candidatus Eisenbacteria bacterium]
MDDSRIGKRTSAPLPAMSSRILFQALDEAPDAIVIIDSDGMIQYCNSVFTRIFDHSLDSIKEAGLESIFADYQMDHYIKSAINNSERWTGELLFKSPGGNVIPCDLRISPINGAEDGGGGTLFMIKDLSKQKAFERQLLQAQKLESIGQLAAGIAHEINTPTQFVGDNTRFLKEACEDIFKVLDCSDRLLAAAKKGTLDSVLINDLEDAIEKADIDYLREEIPIATEQALEGIHRIATIVRAMKEFSHPGSDTMQLTDINKSIQSTITVATNHWKYVADLKTDFDPQLTAVPCFPGEINQTVLNLIVNAADALESIRKKDSDGKGLIQISTKFDPPWAEIRVKDTGGGIPKKIQDNIFDPFFTTKEVGKGSGQGLAIAYATIINKHKGSISFETEPGVGTTFIIKLPLQQEADDELAA